jgi:hypothetical protein
MIVFIIHYSLFLTFNFIACSTYILSLFFSTPKGDIIPH